MIYEMFIPGKTGREVSSTPGFLAGILEAKLLNPD
jgi:hypothetical protein